MKYTQRNYGGPADLPQLIDCKRACTASESIADYPTVSDLFELLDASVPDLPENVSLWESTIGNNTHYCIKFTFSVGNAL
jgi:hypothetical protein